MVEENAGPIMMKSASCPPGEDLSHPKWGKKDKVQLDQKNVLLMIHDTRSHLASFLQQFISFFIRCKSPQPFNCSSIFDLGSMGLWKHGKGGVSSRFMKQSNQFY